MNSADRRRTELFRLLEEAGQPITGSELARKLGVSRQVIVQDVALLRAQGEQILATPRGYLVTRSPGQRLRRTIACRHSEAEIKDELYTIVDLGGKVIDVTVEHPLYGEIRGLLMINSRYDVGQFLKALENTRARPLSLLTYGVHLHTVEVEDPADFERIHEALKARGFLLEDGG